jgi:hypothetical protein
MNELVVSDDIYRKERAVASIAGVKITGCKHGVLVKLAGHS